jgi:hypothetical protein
MNNKSMFANTINGIGDHANLSANECERYGMTWGCDGDCPVFSRGDCKIEDIPAMRDSILNTNRFDDYDIDELNKLYPKLKL